jgi:hypothetical protein
MRTIQILLCVILATTLMGCDRVLTWSPPNRYQLLAAPDGRTFRIDSIEGHVFVVDKDVLIQIPEDTKLTLNVGRVYKFEDGRWMKYLGNGQFQPSEKVINWKDLK